MGTGWPAMLATDVDGIATAQALRPTPPPAAILGRDKDESMAEMQLANYPTHARR
jgi:hypothetical protein